MWRIKYKKKVADQWVEFEYKSAYLRDPGNKRHLADSKGVSLCQRNRGQKMIFDPDQKQIECKDCLEISRMLGRVVAGYKSIYGGWEEA